MTRSASQGRRTIDEPTTFPTSARNAFVQVGTAIDGTAKLIAVDGAEADIEYFESPIGPRTRKVRVPLNSLKKIELPAQTRVFCFDSDKLVWRVGRIDGGFVSAEALRTTEDHYHVRFPNDEDARIPISLLYVRWSHPIDDPTEYLAGRITDTPFFFDGRSQIVRYMAQQRAAFGGLTALASSAVELLEHQITTVRKILADPIERYLLADEVGLGKTIEAGILIRQHILDRPHEAKILIVVPRHLVQQWKIELAEKFFLSSTAVTIMAHDEVGNSRTSFEDITMLVVDEAHRPALLAFHTDAKQRVLYDRLRDLANRIPRVLLLSGTPVLHNEDGFLAMLHLLDPQAYSLNEREYFRRRVRDRQTIAEATADLSDDASSLFVEDAIQRLEALFSDDHRLAELCTVAREYISSDIDNDVRVRALRSLRIHLTETYRLHRRLLRTRRSDPRVQIHLPQRTGAIVLEHDDHARAEAEDFLDSWRLKAIGSITDDRRTVYEPLFALFVEAALSHPRVLLRHITARLAISRKQAAPPISADHRKLLQLPLAFDDEEIFLVERRDLIAQSIVEEQRIFQLLEWLRANSDVRKILLFVDDVDVAGVVADILAQTNTSHAVLRFDGTTTRLHAFEQNSASTILVCDGTTEEGLNLQKCGAVIVNYDLPLEPTRIEQRIGRVDRIEARGRIRIVVFSSGAAYENKWLTCLNETIRVFNRSVAPLQYVLVQTIARIRSSFLVDGRSAIEQESSRMSNSILGLDAELRRIEAQEALDSVEVDLEQEQQFFTKFQEADEEIEDSGEKALNSWVTERLGFLCHRLDAHILRYIHDLRRPTLVPLAQTINGFGSCIDPDPKAGHSKHALPLEPATFERSIAEKKRVALLRVGHPFVNALEAMVTTDDRGTAFAMWRHIPRIAGAPRLFFRFDFFIEADLSRIRSNLEGTITSLHALRRRADDGFPVEYRSVWLDADIERVEDLRLLQVLGLPFSRAPRADGGRDVNLRGERWEKADSVVPIGDWAGLCHRARDKALRLISEDQGFGERCRRYAYQVRDTGLRINESLNSRIRRLSGKARDSEQRMAALEFTLAEALAEGIEKPSIRLDSAGAIFLSRAPL
jgi:ATP-dependent helicase HepA